MEKPFYDFGMKKFAKSILISAEDIKIKEAGEEAEIDEGGEELDEEKIADAIDTEDLGAKADAEYSREKDERAMGEIIS